MEYRLNRHLDGSVSVEMNINFKNSQEAFDFLSKVESLECSSFSKEELELIQLMAQGKKLEAVKLYKERSGEMLRESKEYVENLYDRYIAVSKVFGGS
jgi:ribosomal protein L7/L12